jgi:intracellular sulfur oxidation DsrE/DsrF family protein
MMRRAFIATTLAAVTLLFATPPVLAQTARQGVVVQVSDESETNWNQAINVVRNLQSAYGKDKVDVELVVFGNGAGLLKFDSPLAGRIDDILANSVQVVMCENSMKARKLTPADMHAKIGYVKAGVVEIIERQKQGWAVIRP